MSILKMLWHDEFGAVVSAEAVMVGTVGVLGAVAGLNTAGHALDAELKEVSFAIRSLDQSYGYCGHRSCCAWTAGSSFIQTPVADSLVELEAVERTHEASDSEDEPRTKKLRPRRPHRRPRLEDRAPTPLPNDLPPAEAAPETPPEADSAL